MNFRPAGTKSIQVLFKYHWRAKYIKIRLKPFAPIQVTVPPFLDMQTARDFVSDRRDWIEKQLEKIRQFEQQISSLFLYGQPADRKAARRQLVDRLDRLAAAYGYTYNRVFVRNQKTRWGSCSAKKNISLNMKLLRLPPELLDFVLLHELVHTRHMNHGKDFRQELLKVAPNAKELERRLKQYSLAVI